uniref:Uncharacterized protein n=1 Tax=Trichobilharzia regenti TaxID=157069 RepID=A0AA85K036_TRIRE|nr:unnamed protein product [Trichobilharzia regenti]
MQRMSYKPQLQQSSGPTGFISNFSIQSMLNLSDEQDTNEIITQNDVIKENMTNDLSFFNSYNSSSEMTTSSMTTIQQKPWKQNDFSKNRQNIKADDIFHNYPSHHHHHQFDHGSPSSSTWNNSFNSNDNIITSMSSISSRYSTNPMRLLPSPQGIIDENAE